MHVERRRRLPPAHGFQVRLARRWLGHGAAAARRHRPARRAPDIPGLRERWARDVLHCPYCHGWEVRDRRLGVLGDCRAGAVRLRPDRAAVDRRRRALRAGRRRSPRRSAPSSPHAPSASSKATSPRVLVDDDALTRRRAGRRSHRAPRRAVRPAALRPEQRAARRPRLRRSTTTAGSSRTPTGRTSVPGVWVAGNVANPRAQVITAAGEGSAAAIASTPTSSTRTSALPSPPSTWADRPPVAQHERGDPDVRRPRPDATDARSARPPSTSSR